jgi:hypothetical protein
VALPAVPAPLAAPLPPPAVDDEDDDDDEEELLCDVVVMISSEKMLPLIRPVKAFLILPTAALATRLMSSAAPRAADA